MGYVVPGVDGSGGGCVNREGSGKKEGGEEVKRRKKGRQESGGYLQGEGRLGSWRMPCQSSPFSIEMIQYMDLESSRQTVSSELTFSTFTRVLEESYII
jgi:hypothetical protein